MVAPTFKEAVCTDFECPAPECASGRPDNLVVVFVPVAEASTNDAELQGRRTDLPRLCVEHQHRAGEVPAPVDEPKV